MRIALVCSEVIRESGHGRYMLELARRLAPEHEVHVYSHLYQPVPGVTHHRVPAPVGVNLIRVFAFYVVSSLRLAFTRYDIVHAIGGCTARQDVVTAQFCQRAWGAEMKRQRPEEAGPRRGLAGRLRRIYHEIYWRTTDLLEARAFRTGSDRRLIAVSRGVREELARYYGADPAQVAVVYNGVEPGEFSAEAVSRDREATRAALGFAAEEPVLLFVGDFYRKGLLTVLDALAAMKTPNARLLVVGRGEIEAFRALAAARGVAERVQFVGFQPDVVPYFAASDAFVFPTRYEPFGMVITEAMAAGLPVVTTRAAGAAEVITPGVDGEVVADPDDAAGMAARLDALLADPARRSAMGAAARATALKVNWDYVAAETLKVYEDLLTSRP
jgi:UDP-glucose:(heptosyl)LPS alpha-1,3-glucosyltransferase